MRFLPIVAVCLLAGCGSSNGPPDGPTDIRIVNRSQVALENVVIKFPDTTEDFGTIAPGEATDYRTVPRAYSYAYVEASIEGQPAVLQPIDYVGEQFLGPGNFTYALSYNRNGTSEHDRMGFELVLE